MDISDILDDMDLGEIITPNIGEGVYADFKIFNKISYNCISKLVRENELVWKLLKYPHPDAWQKPDLTAEEKSLLIYNGQGDSSEYRVFMDSKQPDVLMEEIVMVRIFPTGASSYTRTYGNIGVGMQVYSHYKINHLTNYTTRVDTIAGELIALFNGADDIGGLGKLTFTTGGDDSNRLFEVGQIPFTGKQIIFSSRTG